MTLSRSFVATTVFVALVAVTVAFAQGPGSGRGGRGPDGFGGPGGPGAAMGGLPLRQLNLSETQQQQIRDVTQQYRERNQQAAAQLRTALEAQRDAVDARPVNEGLIRSTTQALVEAQTELAIQRAHMQNEIFALLTPPQQEQLAQLRADRETRMQQQRPGRGQRPQPQQ